MLSGISGTLLISFLKPEQIIRNQRHLRIIQKKDIFLNEDVSCEFFSFLSIYRFNKIKTFLQQECKLKYKSQTVLILCAHKDQGLN